MNRYKLLLAGAALFVSACASSTTARVTAPVTPRDGRELITRMHDAYAGKWYNTLTFVQKTTVERPGSAPEVTTWYEALQSPGRLRIDMGDPALGNGVIYTADSLYAVRGGKQVRASAGGNEFLPFVGGIYTLPVETAIKQVEMFGFPMTPVRSDTWQGRPVYVVGAAGPEDLESPQFWVDAERLIAVRIIKKLDPTPGAKAFDIQLNKYVPLAGGWLATSVSIMQPGGHSQTEEYTDWKANVALPAQFFDAANWNAVPHWSKAQ